MQVQQSSLKENENYDNSTLKIINGSRVGGLLSFYFAPGRLLSPFHRSQKLFFHRQMEAIPASPRQKGNKALFSLTTGSANTAVGWFSLGSTPAAASTPLLARDHFSFNTADDNTAIGAAALLSNTTGSDNTANGAFALFNNTDGGFNTANGDLRFIATRAVRRTQPR